MLVQDHSLYVHELSDAEKDNIIEQIKQQAKILSYQVFWGEDGLEIWVEDILIFWQQVQFDNYYQHWKIPWVSYTLVEEHLSNNEVIHYNYCSQVGWIALFNKHLKLMNATAQSYD